MGTPVIAFTLKIEVENCTLHSLKIVCDLPCTMVHSLRMPKQLKAKFEESRNLCWPQLEWYSVFPF